ncbi:MAG: L,D-transpeptidase [Myxococcales bacterium]|nr:L,D-transpeptidase [Myxococcales bacterium]MCA9514225.1 L,D-transpeptidase [Myxococcales bacterium]MCB9734227.1 L,D-transpeptidase [Deltaproteobacteria bacterium]
MFAQLRIVVVSAAALAALTVFPACDEAASSTIYTSEPVAEPSHDDLPLGPVEDMKEDGVFGHATECKAIPYVEPLRDPAITVSLDGLTLHLVDRAGTYDRVFPIGPGQIKDGLSLTPVSTGRADQLFYTRTDVAPVDDVPVKSQAKWAWNYRCRMWWTDEAGQKAPVFAGLPFIRLEGPSSSGYGIHGPIDHYTDATGGSLRRGYVSHGCMRMEAADVMEVWGRIQGHRTPVRIQQAVERREDDRAVDVGATWMMTECRADADCGFSGGFCKKNAYSERGFCTQRCTKYCPDIAGAAPTFCVADPDAAGQGMCVLTPTSISNGCRRYDHFVERTVGRFGQASVKRAACMPGTEGWIGDHCLADGECASGLCMETGDGPGTCTTPCTSTCADKAGGYATTFCVAAPQGSGLSGGTCVAQCAGQDDCPMGTTCEAENRYNRTSPVKNVCLPD